MFRSILQYCFLCIFSVVLMLSIAGCSKKEESYELSIEKKVKTPEIKSEEPVMAKAEGPTMDQIFTSGVFYTCTMHPEIVTTHPAKCPLCNMELTRMEQKDVSGLFRGIARGCPMCPVVVPADSKTENCPICKMNLVKITKKGVKK